MSTCDDELDFSHIGRFTEGYGRLVSPNHPWKGMRSRSKPRTCQELAKILEAKNPGLIGDQSDMSQLRPIELVPILPSGQPSASFLLPPPRYHLATRLSLRQGYSFTVLQSLLTVAELLCLDLCCRLARCSIRCYLTRYCEKWSETFPILPRSAPGVGLPERGIAYTIFHPPSVAGAKRRLSKEPLALVPAYRLDYYNWLSHGGRVYLTQKEDKYLRPKSIRDLTDLYVRSVSFRLFYPLHSDDTYLQEKKNDTANGKICGVEASGEGVSFGMKLKGS
ncbi:hypothetical protein K438DRAFT_1760471 [Mycena galopus ATCC 62051]|nr:hypothetical protein K438DRAFT_1760471 [Mycena galopus ATCC 62051]